MRALSKSQKAVLRWLGQGWHGMPDGEINGVKHAKGSFQALMNLGFITQSKDGVYTTTPEGQAACRKILEADSRG